LPYFGGLYHGTHQQYKVESQGGITLHFTLKSLDVDTLFITEH